jgi:dipeptide/tripeptide permease
LYRKGSIVLSAAIVAIGVAMLAVTVARGGGPLSSGVVLGLLLCAFGAGRLYLWKDRG